MAEQGPRPADPGLEGPGAPGDAAAPDRPHRSSWLRTGLEWGAVVLGAILIALVVRAFVVQPFYIPSASMYPTLQVGDRVLVNKLSYKLHDVNRGDIVVFDRPDQVESDEIKDLIKRVVGLPGESLYFKDGKVFVDGTVLEEGYLQPGVRTENQGPVTCTEAQPCVVPADHVWVMGDNRENSSDSRWFGSVPQDTIVGRAFLRMWPFGDIGFL